MAAMASRSNPVFVKVLVERGCARRSQLKAPGYAPNPRHDLLQTHSDKRWSAAGLPASRLTKTDNLQVVLGMSLAR